MTRWLLVIDMQPAFGDPESPWKVPEYEACASRVAEMVDAFGDRALFTRFVPQPEPSGAWRPYYARWSFATDPGNAPLWELDERWCGRPSVASHRFSKWREAEAGVPAEAEIVMCGVATDCCVLGTAVEAADAGRQVRIAEDACAAGTRALHEAALRVMADRAPMIETASVDDILARGAAST